LVRVCAEADLGQGEIRRVAGLPIVVCRDGDTIHALGAVCTHSWALLVGGEVMEGCLRCPLHGALFALTTGAVRRGPADRKLGVYPVVVRSGQVYVSTSRLTACQRLRRSLPLARKTRASRWRGGPGSGGPGSGGPGSGP
jgi:nitrite reductase/ring-hydroxylating ferredoxin subunit